jgi:predicted HTH domain antitoxin
MTQSNADKMNLLCDILFGSKMETMNSDNPEWYVQKIDEELQKTSKELTGQTALYNSLYAKYNEAAKTYKPSGYWTDMSKITDDVLQTMSQEISTYKQNINTLTQKMLHVKGVETERKMLHERFENLEKTVASFSNIDASLIQNYRNQIINLENEINNLSKLYLSVQMKEQTKQMLSLKISEIQTQLSSLPKISEHTSVEEINTYRENLNNYESKLSLLKNLQYKYDLCNNSLNLTLQKISELVYVKINDDHELLKSKIKNTRGYNKLNEVKSREPEVLTDFKFESENLEKVVLDLQNYIYNYDNITLHDIMIMIL